MCSRQCLLTWHHSHYNPMKFASSRGQIQLQILVEWVGNHHFNVNLITDVCATPIFLTSLTQQAHVECDMSWKDFRKCTTFHVQNLDDFRTAGVVGCLFALQDPADTFDTERVLCYYLPIVCLLLLALMNGRVCCFWFFCLVIPAWLQRRQDWASLSEILEIIL